MVAERAAVERLRVVPAPATRNEKAASHRRLRGVLLVGLCVLLVVTPLPFGSVQPWAALAIEIAAAILGAGAIWVLSTEPRSAPQTSDDSKLSSYDQPRVVMGLALMLVAFGLFQVFPGAWGRNSAPGAPARSAIATLAPESAPLAAPWSLAPPETVDATTRLAAYVLLALTAFVAVRRREHLVVLALAIVSIALFQALYGSAEHLSGRQSIFFYGKKYYLDSATGTFINRNHFAGYLAAALPLVFALSAHFRGRASAHWVRIGGVFVGGGAGALLGIGLLLSRSRAGLTVAIAAVSLYLSLGGLRRRDLWSVFAIAGAASVIVLAIDVNLPADRLVKLGEDLAAPAGRVSVWREALGIAAVHPLSGYGYGTFEPAFAAFGVSDYGALVYDHAHNEYVQLVLEGGFFALIAVLVALFFFVVAFRVPPLAADGRRFSAALLASCAAVAIHAIVDFGPRVPSVGVFGSVAAGAYFASRMIGDVDGVGQ